MMDLINYIEGNNDLLIGVDSIGDLRHILDKAKIYNPSNSLERKSIDELQNIISDLINKIENYDNQIVSVLAGDVTKKGDIEKLKKDFERMEEMMLKVHGYCHKLGI